MNELELKYGCNPNQKPSRIYMEDGSELPIKVLNGRPGYINFLDAFNGWQLVRELKEATGLRDRDLNAAIGWLACEGKIQFDDSVKGQNTALYIELSYYIG